MRYSYEKKCPVIFVSITVSGVIWWNSAGPSNQFTALLILFALHSSTHYTHSFIPSIPWPPFANFYLFLLFLSLSFTPSIIIISLFLYQVFMFLLHSLLFLSIPPPPLYLIHLPSSLSSLISVTTLFTIPNRSFICLSSSLSDLPSQFSLPPSFSHSVCFPLLLFRWSESKLVPPNPFTGKTRGRKRL